MITYCRDCEHVHPDTRKSPPWKWKCMRVRTMPGFGFVDPEYAPEPPYEDCRRVNVQGECDMFEPLRVAPEEVK